MPDIPRERAELPDDDDDVVVVADNSHSLIGTCNSASSTTTTNMSPAAMDLSRRQSVQRRLSTWKKRTLTFGPQNGLTSQITTNGDGTYQTPDQPPLIKQQQHHLTNHTLHSPHHKRKPHNLPRLRMVHHLSPHPLALAPPHAFPPTPQSNRNRPNLASTRLQSLLADRQRLRHLRPLRPRRVQRQRHHCDEMGQ